MKRLALAALLIAAAFTTGCSTQYQAGKYAYVKSSYRGCYVIAVDGVGADGETVLSRCLSLPAAKALADKVNVDMQGNWYETPQSGIGGYAGVVSVVVR